MNNISKMKKRIFAAIITLVMCAALSVPAFAASRPYAMTGSGNSYPGGPAVEGHFAGQEIRILANQTNCQMNSYVITTKNGGVIVVDGGTEGDATHLRDVIMSKGGHVNAWFITHPHNDHAGALVQLITDGALMQGMAIDAVYYNIADQNFYNTYEPARAAFVQQFRNTTALLGAAVHMTHRNDFYQIDDVIVQVMNDPYLVADNAINNSSVVYRMFIADKKVLFPGDIHEAVSNQFVADHAGEDITADFVQMTHHGSYGASKLFYTAVMPKACMWNAPNWLYNNISGQYQTGEVKRWMNELGVTEHFTIAFGDQVIR